MDYYKKRKLKDKWKEKKRVIIGTTIFLTVGLVALLVGFSLTGWNIIKWLSSPFATTFFIWVGFGTVGVIILLYLNRFTKK